MGRYAHLGLFRRESATDRELVSDAITRAGAEGFADQPLRQLSGGQQQRTHLAQVLSRQAEVLLLDEPLSAIDKESKPELAELLRKCLR